MYLATLYWIILIWFIYSLPRVPKEISFYLSHVVTSKPTKTLCVIVHAPMTSLKVSILNFISWTESWLLKVFYAISVTRALSRTSWMFVVKQMPVWSGMQFHFINICLHCFENHCLRWKQWGFLSVCYCRPINKQINNAFCWILAISVHPLSEKYEKLILFVFISHIVFYKITSYR